MNKDLGFGPAVYGFGAGIYYLGYCFEIPSNLILMRVGVRRWIARIMVTWGLVAMGMAWIHSDISFYVMRFLLGLAEAGTLPGVMFYISREAYCTGRRCRWRLKRRLSGRNR